MALHEPIWIQPGVGDSNINVTQANLRNWNSSFRQATTGVADVQGVLGSAAFLVTQRGAGANFSVDVAAGRAYITDDDVSNGGTYFVWSDATVNVATPGAPGSGTRLHRIILRMRNKGENGTWTTYDFIPDIVTDGGGGFPAEPASSITLAQVSIATGQASVLNANITDYRQRSDAVTATKAGGGTSRTSLSMTDDPDLQLLNLQASAVYDFTGLVLWNADVSAGGISWTFRNSGGFMRYASNSTGETETTGAQTVTRNGFSIATSAATMIKGAFYSGAAPAFSVFQWARLSATANPTTVEQYSFLSMRQIG